jgi:hypothetical protein
MSSNIIIGILDRYAEKVAAAERVQAEIDRLAGDLLTQRKALEAEAESLAKQAKEKAKYVPASQAHTLVGRLFQLVFNRPAARLDEAKVLALVDKYNSLLQAVRQLPGPEALELGNLYNLTNQAALKVEPDPYWTLRKVGKGH